MMMMMIKAPVPARLLFFSFPSPLSSPVLEEGGGKKRGAVVVGRLGGSSSFPTSICRIKERNEGKHLLGLKKAVYLLI